MNEEMEMTFTIEDADLDKLYDVVKEINVKECPCFEVQDKHGNKAKYYRESNWISCKERLPEEDGDYLVTFEEGYAEDYGLDLVGIAPHEVDCEGFGIWQEEFDPHTLGSLGSEWVDINVIAWQPLPEPYKEEGGQE